MSGSSSTRRGWRHAREEENGCTLTHQFISACHFRRLGWPEVSGINCQHALSVSLREGSGTQHDYRGIEMNHKKCEAILKTAVEKVVKDILVITGLFDRYWLGKKRKTSSSITTKLNCFSQCVFTMVFLCNLSRVEIKMFSSNQQGWRCRAAVW